MFSLKETLLYLKKCETKLKFYLHCMFPQEIMFQFTMKLNSSKNYFLREFFVLGVHNLFSFELLNNFIFYFSLFY